MSNGRVKLDDVKPGDKLVADSGFTCIERGVHTVCEVEYQGDPGLAIRCSNGWHFLDGQKGDDGYLIGLTRPASIQVH